MTLDIDYVRAQFPSLGLADDGAPRIYLDNPAGTQVPIDVIRAISRTLTEANANQGGDFVTSRAATEVVEQARGAVADFLGAAGPEEVIFGPNMTSLTYHVGRSIADRWEKGDEIILSRMDHDANVWPWVGFAAEKGVAVKWLDFDVASFEFETHDLDDLLTERTRLVAVGYASNVLGTIHPVREIARKARSAGALSYIDAVHQAPHGVIDVGEIGCDFLACSVYKFFGPHVGVLWAKGEHIESLEAYRLRPAPASGPGKFESGTQNHEGIAGSGAAIDYLESLGDRAANDRRGRLRSAMKAIAAYEHDLAWRLIDGLQRLDGVKIWGVTDPGRAAHRAPTVSFTAEGVAPSEIAAGLTARNIFSWAGHSYAVEPMKRLGLLDKGGVLRLGIAHYNTTEEIDRTLAIVEEVLRG